MNRPMEELRGYKTHPYVECLLGECDECERYYREEIHPDLCDETCPQRYEGNDEGLDLGRCRGCKCEHCEAEDNIYEVRYRG